MDTKHSTVAEKDASNLKKSTDAPLKLWLKRLDSETLEALYNTFVVECTKAKLLGQRDEGAYRANRIREFARHELEYRRTHPPTGENSI